MKCFSGNEDELLGTFAISLVWHREGGKRKRGKRDIAVRMQELADLMQTKFKESA
jgi:hypothetical protein